MDEELRDMEQYVKSIRLSKSKKTPAQDPAPEAMDQCEPRMKVPNSVLDGCEASFTAADKRRTKASTKYFDCTGLMAIMCCHDRILWLANMTTAGEWQFYVLALINKLYEHLPNTTKYYQCLYTLDTLIRHLDRANLEGLAAWIVHKRTDAYGQLYSGQKTIANSGNGRRKKKG
ncbi:hypothetical protein PQX77_020534 [Marasmius sp. AFHP31]|nr:hypothetical protein PQX77_020534 [Marasmius sp. AFHP31]